MLTADDQRFLERHLPFFRHLTPSEKAELFRDTLLRSYPGGTCLYDGVRDCLGLGLVREGTLRAYLTALSGSREITLFRMLPGEACIISASCMIKNFDFPICLEAERDTSLYIYPTAYYKALGERNPAVKDFNLEMMSARFSEVMWLTEQALFGQLDRRLAVWLVERANLDQSEEFTVTHEKIAADLGSAREVVTRMLRHFQVEGWVALSRAKVEIKNRAALEDLAEGD